MAAMAAAAASSMVRVTPSCTASSAQGRGVSQGLVALQAAKQVLRLGEARSTAERAHQRGVTRGFMKISAVAVNSAAPDVAENGEG